MIYLDSAATSLLKPRSVPAAVLGAMLRMAPSTAAGTLRGFNRLVAALSR